MIQIAIIETEDQLKPVLAFCYEILGQHYRDYEQYIYEAWQNRMGVFSPILSYAHADNTVVAAVLGRPENEDSLIMGFTACHEDYRKKGITSRLVKQFEENAKTMGFKKNFYKMYFSEMGAE